MTDPAQVLRQLIDAHELHEPLKQLNEAATRLLIIDTVLSEVLGWPKSCFNPEDAVASEDIDNGRKQVLWLDYHLEHVSTPQRLSC